MDREFCRDVSLMIARMLRLSLVLEAGLILIAGLKGVINA